MDLEDDQENPATVDKDIQYCVIALFIQPTGSSGFVLYLLSCAPMRIAFLVPLGLVM